MRGKEEDLKEMQYRAGITPAYAGKSSGRHTCQSSEWDHPRVCGEKAHAPVPDHGQMGSPPRMRGKVRT